MLTLHTFLNMGQTQSLFVYIRPFNYVKCSTKFDGVLGI